MKLLISTFFTLLLIGFAGSAYGQNIETINYASGSVYVGEFKDSERCRSKNAQVAQSVEQRTENPRVGGSIPPLGTIHKTASPLRGFFMYGV